MTRAAVYRHYDADQVLIYVGCSVAPIARLCEHQDGSPWGRTTATVTIEWWPTKAEALAAEAAAIQTEKPLVNRTGRARRGKKKRLGSGVDHSALIARIDAHIAETRESRSSFGRRAVNDCGLFERLIAGSSLRPDTLARIEAALAMVPA